MLCEPFNGEWRMQRMTGHMRGLHDGPWIRRHRPLLARMRLPLT